MTRCFHIVVLMVLTATTGGAAATLGFVDTFSAPGANGWGSQTGNSNPGTGGVGGAGDGYLLLSQSLAGNFGSVSSNPAYQGDWTAAGITQVSFYLNDVGTANPFSFHLLLTGGPNPLNLSTWQYDVGHQPPNNAWQLYTVDVSSSTGWTLVRGADSFQSVLQSMDRIHFRHDLPPYVSFPDTIAGDLGIDNVRLGAKCNTPRQDADGDADVDLTDFGTFQACFNGPNRSWNPSGNPGACFCFDQDGDRDVDLSDFGSFQSCFNGPNRPAAC
jgi:hypothetical protein